MRRNSNKSAIWKIILASILLLFIILIFKSFIHKNNERIIAQNANYIEDNTKQTAGRINDILTSAENTINTAAYLYEQTMDSPEVDFEKLDQVAEKCLFDYVEFVNAEGMDINSEGRMIDVSDRNYFKEGMEGKSGMDVVFDARTLEENVVVFYSPLRYQGKIIGVLVGHYRQEQMQEILRATYFGREVKSFLCLDDGSVIAYSGKSVKTVNILDSFSRADGIEAETFKEIRKAFADHKPYGFIYQGEAGPGNGYLMELDKHGWIILQTFPSEVTNSMVISANTAGVELEVRLISIFVAYLVLLLVINRKQKRRLLVDNQKKSQIVESITQLFTKLILVDLKADSYEYIDGTKGNDEGVAVKGVYSEMMDAVRPLFVEEDSKEKINELLGKEAIQKHMNIFTSYLQYEYQIRRREIRWENISILCVERQAGIPVTVLLAVQDVTDLKEEELKNKTALKEAYHAAEEASHAKSDFLSRMSHDIRTPMNAIMGMTAVAAMHIDDKERVMDCFNKISVSSRHLLGLINEVLDMSKIESGKVNLSEEEFNLAEAVESLLTICNPQIDEKKQELKVSLSDIIHEDVIGDPMRLQQVFVNIMGNAVKFTPEGGKISFTIREKLSRLHGNGCYEFVFEDNGIGMDEKFLAQIFEPFTRAGDSRTDHIEGTGLGMAITRNIVQMMNGDIQIESAPGKGSKFTVTVYLKLGHCEKEHLEKLAELPILVVDDEADACESACGILNDIGMKADWVLSGEDAIRKMEASDENGASYAAVILDWKMPGKDGVETAREIRSRFGDTIPIIILSAYDWSDIEQQAREAGVDAFIAKPLFRSRLIYVLKKCLGQEEEEVSGVKQLPQKNYDGKHVLLVEDNELNMEIAEELLKVSGILVDKAYDGRQALDLLQKQPAGYYDLVFMDIQMPNMNGYEAARTIRSQERADLKELPIVAMTADAFSEDIQKAMRAGMNGHIAKPIELDKLDRILERWLA